MKNEFMESETEFQGKILLTAEDGNEETFFVLEEAMIEGETYLLVANSPEDDADALILQQIENDDILTYEVLNDENKISVISKYFEDLIEDINFELE